jgi:hypothetical protein
MASTVISGLFPNHTDHLVLFKPWDFKSFLWCCNDDDLFRLYRLFSKNHPYLLHRQIRNKEIWNLIRIQQGRSISGFCIASHLFVGREKYRTYALLIFSSKYSDLFTDSVFGEKTIKFNIAYKN